MVKLTKRCLRKTLRNASLRYEELETILTETESILNSRPLTFLYYDVSKKRYNRRRKVTIELLRKRKM